MFPLKEHVIGGYRYGEPTFYSAHHLGVDLHAPDQTPLHAPFDGTILEAFEGVEGGRTIWFKPDHDDVIMRFLHLDYFAAKKGEHVTQGQQIALTGHSGRIVGTDGKVHTYAPHLHLDISRGSFILAWPGHFIDPETYDWDLVPGKDSIPAPLPFWITVDAPAGSANFRSDPTLQGKVMRTYPNGTQVECIDTVEGEEVTVHNADGSPRTSKKWYKSLKNEWFISAAVATH